VKLDVEDPLDQLGLRSFGANDGVDGVKSQWSIVVVIPEHFSGRAGFGSS
jgi:hypothetical protein